MSYYHSNWMSTVSPYDRKTKALNKLINGLFKKDILSEKSTLRALYLVKSYTGCYTIVFEMDGEYRNEDVLIWIIISTVDKILEWWDITDSYNLDIEYITRGRRPINKNYFELLFHSYNNRGNIRGYNPDDVVKSEIINSIAKDENVIPVVMKILERERQFKKEIHEEMNLLLSKAHIGLDNKKVNSDNFMQKEIIEFYTKYRGYVGHCFKKLSFDKDK